MGDSEATPRVDTLPESNTECGPLSHNKKSWHRPVLSTLCIDKTHAGIIPDGPEEATYFNLGTDPSAPPGP